MAVFVAGIFSEEHLMSRGKSAFRVGKVRAYWRGNVWYLCYMENGRRRRPRIGPDRDAANQLVAPINSQRAAGAAVRAAKKLIDAL